MIYGGMARLIGRRTDIANSTPCCFGELQDVSIEASFTEKELKGRKQFAIDTFRSGGKISGKAKTATIRGALFNQIFFGGTLETGSIVLKDDEAGTIPSATAFEIEVAESAHFYSDLGVTDLTGKPYTLVTGTPATGQYAVSAGTYTFASADAGKSVLISYLYTATTGSKLTLANLPAGASPTFEMVLGGTYKGKSLLILLNQCTSTKLNMPFKNEDHMISEIDLSVGADSSGNIGTWSFSD